MLTDIQVFQALENALPTEIRPLVIRRVHRMNALWSALHEESFLKKAVSFAGADPDRWRPGLLGLLLASETDYLRTRFEKTGSSSGKLPEASLVRAQTALRDFDGSAVQALDQAALAALALNESLAAADGAFSEIPAPVWNCLYSIGDGLKAIERLAEMLPQSAPVLLEVLLENESVDKAAELLERYIPAVGLSSAAALCDTAAAVGELELARRISAAVSAKHGSSDARAGNPDKRVMRARMLRLAGDPSAALPEADAARKDAKRMLLDTLMESAYAAEAEHNYTSALSFWQEAGSLSPATAGIRAGMARSLSGLGREEEALAALPSSSEDPDDLLLIARIRAKAGAKEKAIDAARQAFAKSAANSNPQRNLALAGILADCGDLRGSAQILAAVSRSWPDHPDVFSRLADIHAQLGDWHSCASAAASAWHLHPEDNRSLRLLAQAAEHENRPKDAADYYRLLSERETGDPAILLALAQASFRAGDSDQAQQAAEQTLALQPECGQAHAVLGLVELKKGEEEKAFASLQKATRLAPATAAPWKALAEMHSGKGNREAAATTLRAGIESASDPAELLLALGRTLFEEGRMREAATTLQRALDLRPEDTEILFALAETALGMQQPSQAEGYLERAIAISPALFHAVKALVTLLKKQDRLSEARSALERALAADPQSPDLLIEQGALLLEMHRQSPDTDPAFAATALAFLRQAEELLGGKADFRLQSLIGWAQIYSGQLPEAVALFGSLLQSLENLAADQKSDAHTGLAEAMLRSGDYPTAIHNLQSAIQISNTDTGIRLRLGEAYAAAGLHEDAQDVFRKILAEKMDHSPALSGLAASLLALNRSDEAVALLHQASELEPANPEFPMRLAEIHLQSGNGSGARSEMARALQTSGPGNTGIALRAGRLLSALKEYSETATVLENALEHNPSSVPLLTDLGNALRRSGMHARAFEIFRRASEVEPDQSGHLAAAAESLWADGRKSAALAFFKKAVQIDAKNSSLLRRLASGLAVMGLTREALPHYEQAIALEPSDANLAIEAAKAAFQAGDYEKADLWKDAGTSSASPSAESAILQARIALEKNDLAGSIEACNHAVTSHPADARGWALLAQSLALQSGEDARTGRPAEGTDGAAESALAKAVELCSESTETLELTGRAAILMAEYPEAVRCLESLCSSAPDDPEAHTLLAQALILQEESRQLNRLAGSGAPLPADSDGQAARASLARAAALGSAEKDLQSLYARAALAVTRPEPEAIESLERLNNDPASPEAAAAAALAWLRAGDAERARKAAEIAVNLQPEKETTRTLSGICEWKAGRPESALASLQQASRFAPRRALPHAVSAAILAGLGRRPEAMDAMLEAVRLAPETAAWQHTLGTWNEDAGNRAAALPCLQRAAELEPMNGEYHRHFAHAILRDGDPQTALAHFRKAASLLPDPGGELQAEIGKAAIESGRHQEAYEAFRQAQEKAGSVGPAAWQLGKARAALALGRRDEARTIAKNILGGEGHPPEARLVLAEVEEAEGRLPEAIRHLDHAASEMSDPVLPALRLARLWTATGAAVRSSAAMQALLEAHPENDEAHYLLAEALSECGRLEDALRTCQKAAELAPRNAGHWILLGRISRKMGQLDQSLSALTRAREIAPRDFRTALECGLTYEAEQRWDLALNAYRAALELSPENAEVHYRMGVVHKNLRSYSDAASALRKAVQIEPQNLAAHKLLSGVMALSLVYGITPQSADAR
ncbi:MAG: tetratricopeptide repeat protein [Anaerolineales bacterium]|nr:tetratricopeptide repeat protein [Anaerolineales bacterium]